ncbi:DUF1707 domain-containing protein [Rhodococcus sp. F64268]|uniref:DUF1707 SHOCT-like domain-containing protein n=1 Tax=Rhodococcus sp. F64268 TaxID=2926402 RepID=UPI001FF1866A|nr:DUF1707 domain-containing protein [Rhodococcus sp. F64268]MCK0091149.1 DUF1707 domain-containing protein [Rhodococcus sp. F64268]
MAELPEIRIGTAEREEAIALLGEHFAAGRLSLVEFDDRVALATQAVTRADLVPLFSDLPSAPSFLHTPAAGNVATDLLTLVPFALVALVIMVAVRHPIAIVLSFVILFIVVRRGLRLIRKSGTG